jgi:hypothetical protein
MYSRYLHQCLLLSSRPEYRQGAQVRAERFVDALDRNRRVTEIFYQKPGVAE